MKYKLMLLALTIAASSIQAMTLAWNTPLNWEKNRNWTADIGSMELYASASGDLTADLFANPNAAESTLTQITPSHVGVEGKEGVEAYSVMFTIDDNALTENSYIYVVFTSKGTGDGNTGYMVAKSAKYTGKTDGNGFYDNVAQPSDPNKPFDGLGDFVDLTTIGGTWTKATPEPTALALLMLGVAGLALRRRL